MLAKCRPVPYTTQTVIKMQAATSQDLMQYLQEEWQAYGGTGLWFKAIKHPYPLLQLWLARTYRAYIRMMKATPAVPRSFLERYPISVGEMQAQGIQIKYQIRGYNLLREFERLKMLDAAQLDGSEKYRFLDLSSAACGVEACAREFGHTTRSCDFLDGMGGAYRCITDAQNIKVSNFDGTLFPFGFSENSFDFVTCFQAINFYGQPSDYAKIIDDMCRIATKQVLVIFNGDPRIKEDLMAYIQGTVLPQFSTAKIIYCEDVERPGILITCAVS